MPVEVTGDGSVVKVTHVCEGCGEEIRTFECFADAVDETLRPVHDKATCVAKVHS